MTYTLYLNGLTVTDKKLGGLVAPTENDHATTKSYVDAAVAAAVQSATNSVNSVLSSAPDALNTLDELAAALGDDANFASNVINSISNNKTSIENSLSAEVTRATAAEATLTTNLSAEVTRATAAENALTSNLSTEVTRATAAETTLTTNLSAEVTRAQAAEAALTDLINNASSNSVTGLAALTAYIHELHRAFYDNGVKPSDPPGNYTATATAPAPAPAPSPAPAPAPAPSPDVLPPPTGGAPTWTIPNVSVYQTMTLTAPSFALAGATITYTRVSDESIPYFTLNDNVITGVAPGSGQIRASWDVFGTSVSAVGTVTVV